MAVYKIVDKHSGEPIWGSSFGSLHAAKLSAYNNNFITAAVGIAQFTDGVRSSGIMTYNTNAKTWEEK
jgi:hypothetical protein